MSIETGGEDDIDVRQIEDKGPPVEERAEMNMLARTIRDAVAELPQQQRTAFVLRTYEGLSYGEIARVMKCPVGTVKSRMARAEQALRPKLKAIRDELG